MDSCKSHKDGSYGVQLRKEIQDRFEKLQAPGEARIVKALPKPIDKPRKKRGGQKYRSANEKYRMTM